MLTLEQRRRLRDAECRCTIDLARTVLAAYSISDPGESSRLSE